MKSREKKPDSPGPYLRRHSPTASSPLSLTKKPRRTKEKTHSGVTEVSTPTVLSELCGADEGGDLKAIFCAILVWRKVAWGFGCLEVLFFHLHFGSRQGQVEFSIFHFLVVTLQRKHVRDTKWWTKSLMCK